jgi:outer membrane protein OmpA-like peptidoglycan-associated protein
MCPVHWLRKCLLLLWLVRPLDASAWTVEPADAAASAPVILESTPTPAWSPRAEAALQALQRAVRGGGIAVEREGHRIRLSAWDNDAFAPNTSELALPLRALLDEWTDRGSTSGWRVVVAGRAAPGGLAQANQQLAQARAQAVQRHLRLRGITAVTIHGESNAPPGAGRRGVELWLEPTE